MLVDSAGCTSTGRMGVLMGLNATCCGCFAHHRSSFHQHTSLSTRIISGSGQAIEAAKQPSSKVHELSRAALQCWQQAWQQRLRVSRATAAAAMAAGALLMTDPLVGRADARTPLTQEERVSVELFKDNTPSVVFITNLAVRRDAFTLDMMEIPQGAGSGFVWDTKGHIVTNYHVIKGASDLQVTMTGGDEYAAQIVGVDADKDVAVLRLNLPDTVDREEKLHPMHMGTSSDLLVGQRVYAIGNPFGLDHTLTSGIISGTGREISSGITGRPIENVIQTDAAINPGNSGGPLLDSSGAVIGIATAIYSPSGANSGVGFAVPVDVISSSVDQIIRFGKVLRPILGISFAPDQSVEQLQLGVQGILVLDARENGPAASAGVHGTKRDPSGRLMLGDIITGFNTTRVKNSSDLFKALDRCAIGDTIDLEVLRDNDKQHLQVTLGSSA